MADLHTRLLLHGESLEDSSPFGVPFSNHGIQVSTGQSKFGSKSLYFNGSAYATFPRDTIIYGSGDFTIDWWERPEAGAEARYSNNLGTSAADRYGGLAFGMQGSTLSAGQEPVSWAIDAKNALDVAPGSWTHWAVIRHGNNIATYKNGKKYFSSAFSGSIYYPQGPQVLGRQGNFVSAPHSYIGYIDEFRISDVARWTADFAPPERPYDPSINIASNALIEGTVREVTQGRAFISGVIRDLDVGKVLNSGTILTISVRERVLANIVGLGNSGAGSYLEVFGVGKFTQDGVFQVQKGADLLLHINHVGALNELSVNGKLESSVYKKPVEKRFKATKNFQVSITRSGKNCRTDLEI